MFGNPLVEKDSVPLEILPELRLAFPGCEFVEFDAAEGLEREGRRLLIIDAVDGIPDVVVLGYGDIEKIIAPKAFTMHDFDLGVTLKLLKKMGMLDSVEIVGVPTGMGAEEALPKVVQALKAILPSGSARRS
ncbi:MAG: hypothetical protein V1787_05345 [Candidatus Micrarchaeota archaeon]